MLAALIGAVVCLVVVPGLSSDAVPARAATPGAMLSLPIADGRIVALARIPEPNWLPGHRGIDIAADAAQPVLAPGPGRVAFAGDVAGRPVVAIELDMGLRATLEPVTATVTVDSRVGRGDVVGSVAAHASHCGAQACVHWGLKRGERYVDPLDWLEGYGRIVLLPRSAAPRTLPLRERAGRQQVFPKLLDRTGVDL
jgi:murein DD-endopeptidase MepM/ murein hydrolase activator NlpD